MMQKNVEMSPNIKYDQKQPKEGPVRDLSYVLYTHTYKYEYWHFYMNILYPLRYKQAENRFTTFSFLINVIEL